MTHKPAATVAAEHLRNVAQTLYRTAAEKYPDLRDFELLAAASLIIMNLLSEDFPLEEPSAKQLNYLLACLQRIFTEAVTALAKESLDS